MRDVVRAAFLPFTAPLEGVVPWMYPDVKNLVSTGVGNLIDPVSLAIALPFVRQDGTPATREDIVREWIRIKNLPPDGRGRTAAMLGHTYAKRFTSLRLTPEGIDQLVASKLHSNEQVLKRAFKDWESWPADAQLATLSMAWAVGPAFWSPQAGRNYWPKLTAALHMLDFRTASVECFMKEEATISGLRPRNRANRVLYQNAAIAMHSLDPDKLYYPTDLESGPVDKDAPTLPEIPSRRPPCIEDFAIVHPDVPVRGFEEPERDDPNHEPDPEAA